MKLILQGSESRALFGHVIYSDSRITHVLILLGPVILFLSEYLNRTGAGTRAGFVASTNTDHGIQRMHLSEGVTQHWPVTIQVA